MNQDQRNQRHRIIENEQPGKVGRGQWQRAQRLHQQAVDYLRDASRVLEHSEDRITNLFLRMEAQAEFLELREKVDSKQVADLLQNPDRITEDEQCV